MTNQNDYMSSTGSHRRLIVPPRDSGRPSVLPYQANYRGPVGMVNRIGRTVEPLPKDAPADNHSDKYIEKQVSKQADSFMPTLPIYSPNAIPTKLKTSINHPKKVASFDIKTQLSKPLTNPSVRPKPQSNPQQAEAAIALRKKAQEQAQEKARQDELIERLNHQRHSANLTSAIINENQLLEKTAQAESLAQPQSSNQDATEEQQAVQAKPAVERADDIFAPVLSMSSNLQAAGAGVSGVSASIAGTPVKQAVKMPKPSAILASFKQTGSRLTSKTAKSNKTTTKSVQSKKRQAQARQTMQKIAGAKVTFSFKINKKRIANFLRSFAIITIIAASSYLAWDTYNTSRSVEQTFSSGSSASAMSIAGANPATADQTAISRESMAAYKVPADQPRYIRIPAINVEARVMSVGVNSRGNINTPTNLNDTAWYDGSAKPGQEGQVFIDGHTSFSSGIAAAFNNLHKLNKGDKIDIEKGNGEIIKYRVVDQKTVGTNDVDMGEALNPPKGVEKGLTLMTCTGTFNYRTQTADKRLIIYAVQE